MSKIPKLVVDVARAHERLVAPGAREIVSALADAGHEVKLLETYVKLSPRFPFVDKKGWLYFADLGWSVDAGLDRADWASNQSTNHLDLKINIQGLTVGATYALSILVQSAASGANPMFNAHGGMFHGPVWYVDVPAKPQQVFVIPITADAPLVPVYIASSDVSRCAFWSATVYAP